MYHHRSVLFTIRPYICYIKTLRHLHIELYSPTLPRPSNRILKMKIKLRPIKSSIPFIYHIRNSYKLHRLSESCFRRFPFFICSHGIIRSCGKLYMVGKPEHFIYIVYKLYDSNHFVFYLLRKHKYMSIILRKCSHSHKPVKSP